MGGQEAVPKLDLSGLEFAGKGWDFFLEKSIVVLGQSRELET